MTEHHITSSERLANKERLILTPEALYHDNTSYSAFLAREEWDTAHDANQLTLTWGCADSRLILSRNAFYLRSIAAGGAIDPFIPLLEHCAGVKMVSHFRGDSVKPGERPSGCGGQDEKAALQANGDYTQIVDGPAEFVHTSVYHEDPVMNSMIAGYQVSQATGVPVISIAQDHLNGQNHLLAVYQGGRIIKGVVTEEDIQRALATQEYDPKKIYANGIPSLDLQYLPRHFEETFRHQEMVRRALYKARPDLEETQKVQNPPTLLVSTDPRPAGIKYPGHFGFPNSVFGLRSPRMAFPDGSIVINNNYIRALAQQAEYALMNALQNRESGPFHSLRNIIIESRHPDVNDAILRVFTQRPVFQQFLQLEGAQILTGVVDQGVLVDCSVYGPTT